MQLVIDRKYKLQEYTIGKLYIDDEYFCDTLEDTDRNLSDSMSVSEIQSKKIYGQTAIPLGTYKVDMDTVSPKFKNRSWAIQYEGKIPRIKDIKGFDGVLIHPLNSAQESLGCIGVGENKVKGKIINSTQTFHKLMSILLKDKDNIVLTIK